MQDTQSIHNVVQKMAFGLLLFAFCASCCLADVIIFHDGRELEGEVIGEEGGYYIIKGRFGKTKVNKREVKEIRKVKSPREVAEAKRAVLLKTKGDANAWFELGQFAESKRLRKYVKESYTKAIEADPQHEGAHKALGHVRYLGQWIPLEQKMRLEGKVKVGNRWVAAGEEQDSTSSPETSGHGETKETDQALRDKMSKATGMSNFSDKNEKQVVCPHCKGSGYIIWLQCNNCNLSDKPGYKFTGTGYILCNRCNGKTKFPGMICPVCKKQGKVYLSRVHPLLGGTKKAPQGYKWCSACQGAKYGEMVDCNQCKGSEYPGYTYHGDSISVCNRCNGLAKIPLSNCATCKGSGLERTSND